MVMRRRPRLGSGPPGRVSEASPEQGHNVVDSGLGHPDAPSMLATRTQGWPSTRGPPKAWPFLVGGPQPRSHGWRV